MRTDAANRTDISMSKLEEVFATFNQVSADLGSNYKELEARVAGLSEELAATHSARIKELTAKEQLAAKLSSLMEALPGGVIVLNSNRVICEENPAAVQIMGKSFLGFNWFEALEISSSAKPVFDGELSLANSKRISVSSSTYGDDEHRIILITDVSENYQLNNLLNREKRLTALGEMAARLAHQVRTPLSSAILYISHLSHLPEQQNSSALISGKIMNRLRQIESLVDGLLSYIRGDINPNQRISLNELMISLNDAISSQLLNCSGKLQLDLPDSDCMIKANKEALFNAVSNLIDNSIQAADQKPQIKLGLVEAADTYIITVQDDGPGVPDSIREHIFDPFFSTRTTGTGLGLAVVQSVITALHGSISVSTASSGGAIFELRIPISHFGSSDKSGIWGSEPQQLLIESTKEKVHA